MASSQRGNARPGPGTAIGFAQIINLDLKFNYLAGRIDPVIIDLDSWNNGETETSLLIHGVGYLYIRVSKKNPETGQSSQNRIKRAQEHAMYYASQPKTMTSVLRVVREPVIVKLGLDEKTLIADAYYLENSITDLDVDKNASGSGRELPHGSKKKEKAASKKRRKK